MTILAILRYGLDLLLSPFRSLYATVLYVLGRPTNPAHLIPPPPTYLGPGSVDWHGPCSDDIADNDYYVTAVRGRGRKRKPNHLLIRSGNDVARLVLTDEKRRIDQHGLTVVVAKVHGATCRRLRKTIEILPDKTIHLCRRPGCSRIGVGLHIQETASIDADDLVTLPDLTTQNQCWHSARSFTSWGNGWITGP